MVKIDKNKKFDSIPKPVDFSVFNEAEGEVISSIDELKQDEIETLQSVGVRFDDDSESGKFLMYGSTAITLSSKYEGVEIMPLCDALELYPEIKSKYYFKAVDKDEDEFTKSVYKNAPNGYFVRVRKNVVIDTPLHSAMFMYAEMGKMTVHNIVVLEEGAHLHLITGCASACAVQNGLHIAVSEHYVGKGAKLISTMVHNWGPEFVVRPRSGTIVDDDATYVSNYYSVKPARDIQTSPLTRLDGKNASAKYMTVLACLEDTYSDIGGTVMMNGENSSAELVSRAVNYGGTVVQTGLLIGAAKDSRGHVDCSGLMLNDKGIIEAVPGLRSVHPDARMSHEAAIGRIDMGEVNYLQSKGLEEMQAIALIVRGFLNIGIEIEGLDAGLEKMIKEISELSGHGED